MEFTPHIVRVFMPDLKPEDIESLKENKPFVLRAQIPVNAKFIQMVAIPSLIDMMGFSGGGGAPGFAFLLNPNEEEMEDIIFLVRYPEAEIWLPKEDCLVESLGMAQCMGMLLAGFSIRGVDLDEFEEALGRDGGTVYGTKSYAVPDFLKQMTMRKIQNLDPNVSSKQ